MTDEIITADLFERVKKDSQIIIEGDDRDFNVKRYIGRYLGFAEFELMDGTKVLIDPDRIVAIWI